MYPRGGLLFVVFLFFFLWIVIFLVIVFFFVVFLFFFLFLVIFVVEVVGDRIQMDWVRLGHFQFHFAFGAAQDFALLYFIFIHVNFGATIGAANHGTILRTVLAQGCITTFLFRVCTTDPETLEPEFAGRNPVDSRPPPTVVLYNANRKVQLLMRAGCIRV